MGRSPYLEKRPIEIFNLPGILPMALQAFAAINWLAARMPNYAASTVGGIAAPPGGAIAAPSWKGWNRSCADCSSRSSCEPGHAPGLLSVATPESAPAPKYWRKPRPFWPTTLCSVSFRSTPSGINRNSHFDRDFPFRALARTSYASPVLDTTNLPPVLTQSSNVRFHDFRQG
jgi:hypothetical protein